jgi:hypothetical protein
MTETLKLAASLLVRHFQVGLRKHERLEYMFTKVVKKKNKKILSDRGTRKSKEIRFVTDMWASP